MSNPADNQSLFTGFETSTKKDWIDLAIKDLKGADFERKLVWQTPEGFAVDPFYTREDSADLEYLEKYRNAFPSASDSGKYPRTWQYLERISVTNEKKANALALEGLNMGADGIVFQLSDEKKKDPALLFNGFSPNVNPVIIRSGFFPERMLKSFMSHFRGKNGFSSGEIAGGLDYDPLREYSLTGELHQEGFQNLASFIRETENMDNFRVLTINGGHFQNSGSDSVLEVAFTLNVLVEYLDRFTTMGLSPRQVTDNLRISMTAGTNYFMEIAKLKALRILFPYVLDSFGEKTTGPHDLEIHCDTSLWTKTIYDPHVNLLRNTTEAMAAILGGTNSLSILPFDVIFSRSNGFSRRISRNISNLLRDEAYFSKVTDPAAGSYYIEALTDKLIERSLDVFREIEKTGGFVKAFEKGLIQEKVATARGARYSSISSRKQVIVGVNQYANPVEKLNTEEIKSEDIDFSKSEKHLVTSRASWHFEKLRLDTDRFVTENGEARRPEVFLSLIGANKVMRKARSTFASGFFSCAGFRLTESSPSSSLFESVQKAVDSHADIVVICGSDDDYAENGADYAKAFKANHHGILVIAGNPGDMKDKLMAAGIDDFIHIKTNVIESLRKFQGQLKITKN